MAVKYGLSSPYRYTTLVNDSYLNLYVERVIPKQADDILFTINAIYQYRPDKLAYDLYNDSMLWWVFVNRNKNTLKDPIWDFKMGTKIFLPKKSTLEQVLGL